MFAGIAEFGSVFFTRHTMVLAAREGARQLAIEGATESEAQTIVTDYLAGSGITGATVTAQNAYKGSGDDAAARQVTVHVEIPAGNASIVGDMLNVFGPSGKISADVSMRKEGELVSAPASP